MNRERRRRSLRRSLVLRTLLAAIAIGVALGGHVTPAEAHAVLVRSAPAADARLDASPPAIDLWFSEPLEERFSTFELLDTSGRTHRIDGLAVDPADEHHLSGLPRRLPPGVYTVAYRTLSQQDGHEWAGTFAFTVLNADGSVPSGVAYAADVERGSEPALVAGRWLLFLGFAVFVGGALLVLLDSHGRSGTAVDEIARDASMLYRRLAIAALPALVGGSAVTLINQALALDTGILEVLGGSRFGAWWTGRTVVIAMAAAALAIDGRRADQPGASGLRQRPLAIVLPLLGLVGMATITAQSHAAAAPGTAWAMASDLVHFAAAGLWVGGLLGLATLFARGAGRGPRHADALLRRWLVPFSTLAALSVFVLGFTGVLRSLGELPILGALTTTTYGRWLIIKLAVLTPALGVALLNRRALHRAGVSAQVTSARLRRLLAVEAALASVVLLSVAVLGQVPTARGLVQPTSAVTAGTAQDFNGITSAADLTVHLQVSPATLGANQLRAHVYRSDGSDPGRITRVRLTLATSAGAGGQQVDAVDQGNGVFVTTQGFFSLALAWNVRVEIQRAGLDDVAAVFDVPIAERASNGRAQGMFSSPAPQLTLNALAALALTLLGGGALAWAGRRRGASARTVGALLIGGGVMLWVSGETHAVPAQGFPTNPVVSDAASQERGAALYRELCAGCHGPSGDGDGPQAAALTPRPASLAVHMPLHPDGQAFIFISKGFPGTAMPAWESQLSETQRWDLVNYLRALTTVQSR